ncbi:uncharacterized protein YndB with AHSA1/START domain [Roseiarcus fermentans]|uniref:Uncharacterized protein YndB with AHSA1/START domain n=1 Tax=Roseiarcus fermentans TaxID=1473586 RepID=A0A366FL15_9HYPH|nr:SRPBCC family protein [Roseiarcus fermentans]RBP14409.1 uncharacterized protein YndB with AHSA1/START domain [Roseiarcus fermentans]
MTDAAALDLYGALTEPATLTIRRLLPAPIERVWAYLTDDSLRRRWLAAGVMEPRVGAPFEFVWRNDELTTPSGARPEGYSEEHRMQGRITACDPPRRLAFEWPGAGHVAFELEGNGQRTLLTVIHSRLPDRKTTLGVSAGWHAHLDLLAVRIAGGEARPFWDEMVRLRTDYERQLPA